MVTAEDKLRAPMVLHKRAVSENAWVDAQRGMRGYHVSVTFSGWTGMSSHAARAFVRNQ